MLDRSAIALHVMTMVAAFRAATTAGHAIEERRAGRDPSAQEPEGDVRAWLQEGVGRIGSRLVGLRLRLAVGEPENPARDREANEEAALVQGFEDRLALADLALDLRTAHQKLLSLYPAVPEALAEAFRTLHAEAATLALADDVHGVAALALASRTADALDDLRAALT